MVGVFDLIDMLADGALATPDLDYAHDCWLMKRIDEVLIKGLRSFLCQLLIAVCRFVKVVEMITALRMNI